MIFRLRYPLLLMLAFPLAWTCSLSQIRSLDIFWHIAMFRDFWESGLSPFYDHLTYTFNGQPLSGYPPIPFQALAYTLTEWMGINVGIQATKAIAFWITLFAWFCICLRQGWGIWVSIMGTIILLAALQARAIARPEILIYPLLLLMSAWTLMFRHRWSYQSLWMPSVLLIMAAMIHSGAILCFLAAGAYSLGQTLDGCVRRDRSLFLFGVTSGTLFLLLGFVNPDVENIGLGALVQQVDGVDLQWIKEYRTPETQQMAALFIMSPFVLLALLRWLHKRQWIPLLLLGGFGYLSITMSRAIPWVVIALLPWICSSLAAYDRWWRSSGRIFLTRGLAIVCIAAWWFHPGNHLKNPSFGVLYPARYPIGLEYSLHRVEGNVYSIFDFGGYIAYFHPQLKTHQDGRSNMLFPDKAVRENVLARNNREIFTRATSVPVAADFVLSRNDFHILAESAARDERYTIDDADQFFLLFRRGFGRFPVATELLAQPRCWGGSGKAEAVKAELTKFVDYQARIPEGFSKSSRGLSLVEALHRGVLALEEIKKDGAAFPAEMEVAFLKHYRVAKTLAWVAGSRGMYSTAVSLFERARVNPDKWYRPEDVEAYAAALIASGLAESRQEKLLLMRSSGEKAADFANRVINALETDPNPTSVFACELGSDSLLSSWR